MIDATSARDWNRRGNFALVLACISLILSLATCGTVEFGKADDNSSSDRLPVQSEPEVASASQLEAVAHVTLPPGTVLLSAAYSNGLETRLSAKFRMSRSELDAFVSSAKFTAPLTPGLRAVTAEHNVGGGNLWAPGTAKTVTGIEEETPTPDGTRRAVLLDLDTANMVTVVVDDAADTGPQMPAHRLGVIGEVRAVTQVAHHRGPALVHGEQRHPGRRVAEFSQIADRQVL